MEVIYMYTLDLSENELNLIVNGLANEPYIKVYQLIEKIQKAYAQQNEEREALQNQVQEKV